MTDDYEALLELARKAQRTAYALNRYPTPGNRERASTWYTEARALYAGAEALRREREREVEIADAHAHLDGFVRNKACKDCPIGGREGDGPVCPNVDKCDRECEELVQAGREMMGRKPGEACCDLWQDLLPEHHREQADG